MNTSQFHPQNVPDSDLELLSAYLDHQLDAPAQAQLEQRLAVEGALQVALEELRTTTTLLRDLPPLPLPRSFTLDPATAPRRRRVVSLAWFMQFGSGFAGLVLVILASLQFLGGQVGTANAPALQVAEPTAALSGLPMPMAAPAAEMEQATAGPITMMDAAAPPTEHLPQTAGEANGTARQVTTTSADQALGNVAVTPTSGLPAAPNAKTDTATPINFPLIGLILGLTLITLAIGTSLYRRR